MLGVLAFETGPSCKHRALWTDARPAIQGIGIRLLRWGCKLRAVFPPCCNLQTQHRGLMPTLVGPGQARPHTEVTQGELY